jgi:hypothetical protein
VDPVGAVTKQFSGLSTSSSGAHSPNAFEFFPTFVNPRLHPIIAAAQLTDKIKSFKAYAAANLMNDGRLVSELLSHN